MHSKQSDSETGKVATRSQRMELHLYLHPMYTVWSGSQYNVGTGEALQVSR